MSANALPHAAAKPEADAFAEAHRALLADPSIQLDLPRHQPPVTPDWLRAIGQFLNDNLPVLKVLFWILLAALALFILYALARRLTGAEWPWPRKRKSEGLQDSWRPAEAPARQLLSEADLLAGQGRYSEAAHLLLYRSIEDIDSRRPDTVRPALTSRDIAALGVIPAGPRHAFQSIVKAVEKSLFGGQALGEEDWRHCRAAYESFAFAQGWRG
jgi:hypothetical protein